MPASPERRGWRLLAIRYGVGWVTTLGGVAVLILDPDGFGVDGFGMIVGAGLSVLLLNFLFRLGVEGDKERDREEEARRFLEEHGRWPDHDSRVRKRRTTPARPR